MDVGLVCDQCSAFHPMGARTCDRCSAPLSLDVAPQRGRETAPQRPRQSAPVSVQSGGAAGISAAGLTKTCLSCNASVALQNRFCGICGAPMPEETRPAHSVDGAAPTSKRPPKQESSKRTLFFGAMQAARAKLVLIKGDGLDGISFTLAGKEHIAGGEGADLPFEEDPFISPRHANFFYREGRLIVRDEGSVNGVFVRIRGSRGVAIGDRFLVGEQVLEIQDTLRDVRLEPSDDGTYLYTSPRGSSPFRIVQLLRGGGTGLAFRPPSDVVSVGREENDLNFPDDPFISGHHAQVSAQGDQITLTDLGSKNGTFLRVNDEAPLEHGDYVFMGQQLLRVEIV